MSETAVAVSERPKLAVLVEHMAALIEASDVSALNESRQAFFPGWPVATTTGAFFRVECATLEEWVTAILIKPRAIFAEILWQNVAVAQLQPGFAFPAGASEAGKDLRDLPYSASSGSLSAKVGSMVDMVDLGEVLAAKNHFYGGRPEGEPGEHGSDSCRVEVSSGADWLAACLCKPSELRAEVSHRDRAGAVLADGLRIWRGGRKPPAVDEPVSNPFGSMVRRLRIGRGMSLSTFSQLSEVSVPMLVAIERGEISPSLRIASRIAEGSGLSLRELLGLTLPTTVSRHSLQARPPLRLSRVVAGAVFSGAVIGAGVLLAVESAAHGDGWMGGVMLAVGGIGLMTMVLVALRMGRVGVVP